MYSENYKNSLCLLCRQSAFVERMIRESLAGQDIAKEKVKEELSLLAVAKKRFLKAKEEMNYSGGLDFMEDANFYQFRYKDGCLAGNYESLTDITIPWIEMEETEENHFKYEVGTLLLFHYFVQTGRYDKQSENVNHKCKFKWLSRIRRLFHKEDKNEI